MFSIESKLDDVKQITRSVQLLPYEYQTLYVEGRKLDGLGDGSQASTSSVLHLQVAQPPKEEDMPDKQSTVEKFEQKMREEREECEARKKEEEEKKMREVEENIRYGQDSKGANEKEDTSAK